MERNWRRDPNPLCIHAIHIHKVVGPEGETEDLLQKTELLSDTTKSSGIKTTLC